MIDHKRQKFVKKATSSEGMEAYDLLAAKNRVRTRQDLADELRKAYQAGMADALKSKIGRREAAVNILERAWEAGFAACYALMTEDNHENNRAKSNGGG